MPKITSFLWFDTQAEEAATMYVSIFPNSKITDVSRTGEAVPGETGAVLVVAFELDGQPFSALNGGPLFDFSEAISFVIDCKDQAEVDYYWEKLTDDGGQESQCGWLKDKFGVSWQVVPQALSKLLSDPDPVRANRTMQAMLQMKKLDVSALERAAAGQ